MSGHTISLTTRGVRYDRGYLADLEIEQADDISGLVKAGMPFREAIPLMRRSVVGDGGPGREYGCFDIDGSFLKEPGERASRQLRNILYYETRGVFNIRRNQPELASAIPIGYADPVPQSPTGAWALVLTDACEDRAQIEDILKPLVELRRGAVISLPKQDPPDFLDWLHQRVWDGTLPPYLLIVDSYENFPLEYQFLLNAYGVTGRLWLPDLGAFTSYVDKVLRAEAGGFRESSRSIIGSPADDTVTYGDTDDIVRPIHNELSGGELKLESLLGEDFSEASLLATAGRARLLSLYCHGLGITEDDQASEDLHGALVLRFESASANDLLTAEDVLSVPFAPGGIVFTPACLAGGTVQRSDFVQWLKATELVPYGARPTTSSALTTALLRAPEGPIGILAHFDVSVGSAAPFVNVMTEHGPLQTMLHAQFHRHLEAGWTLGRASKPFRWASGSYYARAIHLFSQMTGTLPYDPTWGDSRSIGQAIEAMNLDHIAATDARNFVIFGDPAVRLVGTTR